MTDANDQVAFIEKGIPAIQLFTGPNENYHRPTDTYDKIDGKGLVKVATVTKEVLVYLGDRDTPFEYTGKAVPATQPEAKPCHSKNHSVISKDPENFRETERSPGDRGFLFGDISSTAVAGFSI